MGPFPSAAPGPASMFTGPGPRAGRSYWTGVLGRRARPPLVEFPTRLAPPADRMRLAFPLGVPGRRALRHSTSGGRSRLGLEFPERGRSGPGGS